MVISMSADAPDLLSKTKTKYLSHKSTRFWFYTTIFIGYKNKRINTKVISSYTKTQQNK